jgi:hypothetical protein
VLVSVKSLSALSVVGSRDLLAFAEGLSHLGVVFGTRCVGSFDLLGLLGIGSHLFAFLNLSFSLLDKGLSLCLIA